MKESELTPYTLTDVEVLDKKPLYAVIHRVDLVLRFGYGLITSNRKRKERGRKNERKKQSMHLYHLST